MKKNYVVLFISLSIALTDCGKKSDPGPAITAPVGKIDVKIGGAAFEAAGGAQIANNQIILGGSANSATLGIFITKAATAGTYDVKGATLGTTPDVEITYSDNSSNFFSSVFGTIGASVGTVTITEVDQTNKTISGTFSSTVTSLDGTTSVSMTAGSFNKLPFTTQAAGSLSAKVNGTTFTAGVTVGESDAGVVVINGQAVNGSQIITISVNDDITTGTYDIGDFLSPIYATYTTVSGSTPAFYVSSSGTLTIT